MVQSIDKKKWDSPTGACTPIHLKDFPPCWKHLTVAFWESEPHKGLNLHVKMKPSAIMCLFCCRLREKGIYFEESRRRQASFLGRSFAFDTKSARAIMAVVVLGKKSYTRIGLFYFELPTKLARRIGFIVDSTAHPTKEKLRQKGLVGYGDIPKELTSKIHAEWKEAHGHRLTRRHQLRLRPRASLFPP